MEAVCWLVSAWGDQKSAGSCAWDLEGGALASKAEFWRVQAQGCRELLLATEQQVARLEIYKQHAQQCGLFWLERVFYAGVVVGRLLVLLVALLLNWRAKILAPTTGTPVSLEALSVTLAKAVVESPPIGMSKNWLPLDNVLMLYEDDNALCHHRVVLRCMEGDKVVVATPDRDIFETELTVGEMYLEVRRMYGTRLPSGVYENEPYLFKHFGNCWSREGKRWEWQTMSGGQAGGRRNSSSSSRTCSSQHVEDPGGIEYKLFSKGGAGILARGTLAEVAHEVASPFELLLQRLPLLSSAGDV